MALVIPITLHVVRQEWGPEKPSDSGQNTLFLEWQSFLNISGFQTSFQCSFLLTMYSVIQLYIQCSPMQDRSNTEVHLSLPSAPGKAILSLSLAKLFSAHAKLGPASPDHPSSENTLISPSSEELLPSEIISNVIPLAFVHPLPYERRQERLPLARCSSLSAMHRAESSQ